MIDQNAQAMILPVDQIKIRSLAILRMFRDLSTMGIILTSIVPETSSRFIFMPLLTMWILFSFLTSTKGFIKTFILPDIKSYSVYLWILIYSIFYLTGYMKAEGIENYLLNYARFGFSILLLNYYIEANDYIAIRRLTFFSIGCIVFTCIITLNTLFVNPMAARVLATGREELTQGLTGMGIGSYGFIYGVVFVAIAVFGSLKSGLIRKRKFIFAVLLALFVFTIFKASFMFAILILIITSVLLLLNVKNTPNFIIATLVLLGLFFILSPAIHNVFVFLGDTVKSEALSQRFYEMAYLLKYGNLEGTLNSAARLDLYALSFKSFLSSPIIGVVGPYGFGTSVFGIGGHSAFLDELARYGILGSGFLFVALISNVRFVHRRFKDSKQKTVYYCSMSAFFILGMINTLLFVPVAIMAYFVVPGIICTVSKHDTNMNNTVKKLGDNLNENTLVRQHSTS